jgi:hypothetical protein
MAQVDVYIVSEGISSSSGSGQPKYNSQLHEPAAVAPTQTGSIRRRKGLFLFLCCCLSSVLVGSAVSVSAAVTTSTISYVQGNYGTPQSAQRSVIVQYNSAQTAGDLDVVVVGWNDTTATVKSVSDSAGNAYSLAVGPTSIKGALTQSIYFAKNIASSGAGSNSVTVAFSKSASYPDIRILEYSNADPNNPIDVAAANSGSGASNSVSATTTNATDLLFAANVIQSVTTGAGSGFTKRLLTQPDGDIAEDQMLAAAGSYTATAPTSNSESWIMQMVAFRTPAALGNNPSATPSALSCANSSMSGSGTDACTVTLNMAAASGGLAVSLASNSSAVTVPSSVTVAAGATSASFSATVAAVSSAQTATLTASANGVSQTFALQLNAAVPKLSVSASSLSFGNVQVNTASTQSLTLTSTGTAAVTISSAAVTGSGFSDSGASFPLTLNPNQSAVLTVRFDPSTAGAVSGQLTLASNSSTGSSTAITLSGTGTAAAGTLSSLTCSSNSMTGSGTDGCTVTLSGGAASGGLAVSLTSSNSAVTVPSSVTVAAGATTAGFSATVSSVSSAQTVTLTASAGGVSKIFALQLNAAVPTLSINATSIAFGDVSENTKATQALTLTSSGSAPVTVNSGAINGTGFSYTGATFPLTLNPNQTATLSVDFDPTTAGTFSGQLTISSNSSTNPTAAITLSGTGQATAYTVSVTWQAPTSSPDPVAGYNIYRSPSGGSSYQLMSSVSDTQLSYSDSGVQDGQTYDYIVESVDASGNESVPSNMASVSIP